MDIAKSVIKEPARTRLEAIIARATMDGLVQIAKKVKHKKKKKICGTGYPIGSVLSPPYNILLKNPCSFCPVCLTSTQLTLLDIYLYKLML